MTLRYRCAMPVRSAGAGPRGGSSRRVGKIIGDAEIKAGVDLFSY